MNRTRFIVLSVVLLSSLLGCTSSSNTSMIMDPTGFSPGRYGLYERKSGQLILTHELRPDQTFGFEYSGGRPGALTVMSRRGDDEWSDEWRLPLSASDYQWRPIAETTRPSTVPVVP